MSIYSVSLFAALIIETVQHRLIDIQESPLISAEQELNYADGNMLTIALRRHSLQDSSTNFFEQHFAQHIQNDCDWDEKTLHCNNHRRCHAHTSNWLRSFNIKRDKCQLPRQQRFNVVLRKTSSENELLLMTPSNDPHTDTIPAIRRSFSSGILF